MTQETKQIILGSDHAGWERKEDIKTHLKTLGFDVVDVSESAYDAGDDYPEYAARVARQIVDKKFDRGIILCGTGIGISIAANRFQGIRAALCATSDHARMSRLHNDSNVLVIGGRTTSKETSFEIVNAWLSTSFEGGRHGRRIELLDSIS